MAAELASGKAYLHTAKDVNQRPVIVIRVTKHVTGEQLVRCMHSGPMHPNRAGACTAQHNATQNLRISALSRRGPACHHVFDPLGEFPLDDSKRLCVHLLEKAIASLPEGGETLVGIFDLRGFGNRNADLGFVRFLVRQHTVECCSAAVEVDQCMSTLTRTSSSIRTLSKGGRLEVSCCGMTVFYRFAG